MKHSVKKIKPSAVEITLEFTAEDLSRFEPKVLEYFQEHLDIKGFRKGKIPEKMLRSHISPEEFTGKLFDIALQTTFAEVVKEEKIYIISHPEVKEMKENPMRVLLVVDVLPTAEAIDISKIKVQYTEPKVSESDINEAIERIQKSRSEWKLVERKAKKADRVEINFEGFLGDVAFPGGSGKNYPLVLGSNSFIPGFEDKLIGFGKDETTSFDVTFPKDYHSEDLKGKQVTFTVTILNVFEEILLDINDSFAETISSGELKTVEELKNRIKDLIFGQKEQEERQKFEAQLIDEIIRLSEIELPESLIVDETQYVESLFTSDLAQKKISLEDYIKMRKISQDDLTKELRNESMKRLKIRFTLQRMANELNVEASEEEIHSLYHEMFHDTDHKHDANSEQMLQVKQQARITKTLKVIEESVLKK